jgi:hypothetical protein
MDAGLAGGNDEILSSSSQSALLPPVLPPTTDDVWAILAAFCSGARYGMKIRFPHALVMVFMFRHDLDTRGKLRLIVKAVLEHATSLASFAALYKSMLLLGKVWDSSIGSGGSSSNYYGLRQSLRQSMSAHALGRLLMDMLGMYFR